VIDDDILIVDVVRRILEAEGYQVVTAMNGQEGIDSFRHDPVDLVITDLVMPVKDGLRTIMELREENQNLPIIAISSGGAISKERYLTVAQYLGDIEAIPKPFTRNEIIERVKKIFEGEGEGEKQSDTLEIP